MRLGFGHHIVYTTLFTRSETCHFYILWQVMCDWRITWKFSVGATSQLVILKIRLICMFLCSAVYRARIVQIMSNMCQLWNYDGQLYEYTTKQDAFFSRRCELKIPFKQAILHHIKYMTRHGKPRIMPKLCQLCLYANISMNMRCQRMVSSPLNSYWRQLSGAPDRFYKK